MSRRNRGDRIALWIRDASDEKKVLEIGAKMLQITQLSSARNIQFDFSLHQEFLNSSSQGTSNKGSFKSWSLDYIKQFIK